MIQKEQWLILDFNQKYAISNTGKVKHLKSGNILKQQNTKSGYKQVMLNSEKKQYYRVHRLVAYCFLSNPDNKPYINHIDGDKTNNHLDNLEWCTAKENDIHARENGLKFSGTPFKCFNIKDNTTTIFKSIGEASSILNINKSFIHRCLKQKYGKDTYKEFKFEYLQE